VSTKTRRRPSLSPKSRRNRRLAWTAAAAGAGYAASKGTELLLNRSFEKARGKKPPVDPLARGTSWPKVVAWSVATAVIVAVAQVAAQRGAAGLFERATGHRPPRR
jgi:Protein of unknown function (DUF4235)